MSQQPPASTGFHYSLIFELTDALPILSCLFLCFLLGTHNPLCISHAYPATPINEQAGNFGKLPMVKPQSNPEAPQLVMEPSVKSCYETGTHIYRPLFDSQIEGVTFVSWQLGKDEPQLRVYGGPGSGKVSHIPQNGRLPRYRLSTCKNL